MTSNDHEQFRQRDAASLLMMGAFFLVMGTLLLLASTWSYGLSSTDVTEGGFTDTYAVVLDRQPDKGTKATISIGTPDGQTTTDPTSLVFDEFNWNIPQFVTVAAVDDALVEDSPHTSTITHTASGADGNSINIDSVTVNITDNDSTGVTIHEEDPHPFTVTFSAAIALLFVGAIMLWRGRLTKAGGPADDSERGDT